MIERKKRRAPDWNRQTRPPVPRPPPKSCDCQFHIFGDPKKYPLRYDPTFQPPSATFADMQNVLRILGIERGVIVHSMRFDIDHSLLIDTLSALSPKGLQLRMARRNSSRSSAAGSGGASSFQCLRSMSM